MKTLYLILSVLLCLGAGSASADDFDEVIKKLNLSGCHSIQFVNIIESDIFETVDTTNGNLYLSEDGRFRVEIGRDVYITDSTKLYSYSEENNQVVIEPWELGSENEFSYIFSMDKFYSINPMCKENDYVLRKLKSTVNDHPDSMFVTIDPTHNILKQIEYFDVNEELNRIIFLNQDHGINCDESKFKAEFPDTVEKVRL